MKKNFHNRAELRLEIDRLAAEQKISEQRLNILIREYSVSMKPINLLKNVFGTVKNDSELSNMIKTRGLEALIGFVISNLAFKKSNFLVRTAATLMGTSFASGLFGDDALKYVDKIKQLFNKFRSKSQKTTAGSINEDDIY